MSEKAAAVSRPVVVREAELPLEGWGDPARGAVVWRTLFSGDRTATDSLTLGVAEVHASAQESDGPHRHAHAETYYVLSGHGVLSVDGAEHALAPGTAAFIPGGALHRAWAVGDAPLRILYTFAADAFGDVVYEFPSAD